MSEVAKPVEATPAPATATGTDSTPVPSTAPAAAATEATPASDTITPASETAPAASKGDKAEVVPASEGILGYKGPGLIQSLRFSKRFFWFSDEPFKTDTLDSYLRAEKAEIAHPNAAWAHESGKGLLFFAKRAEDKAAPTGILNLAEISDVTKEGYNEFSFKINGHKHVFQAASTPECSGWIAAIEAKATEAKAMKEGMVSSDGYKAHVERYNKLGVGAATTGSSLPSFSKSKERKETPTAQRKSLDAKVKETLKKDKADPGSASSSDAEKKEKSRSQSRKRTSMFGLLGNKKEDHDEKKEVKKEKDEKKVDEEIAKEQHQLEKDAAKEEKKHEKEVAKEEEKLEKEEKQAEAKATHQPSDIADAGAATVAATAPGAAATASHEKTDETKPEQSTTKSTENHEKKAGKRASIFGSLFGGKKDVTSPTAEKTEGETAPAVPAKGNEVTPVSDTAPKIDEPAQSKPIDTAAVTAPVDSAIAAHDTPATSVHAQTTTGSTAAKSPSTPSHKGGVMGFFKRQDPSKAEQKKETKPDEPVTSPTTTETAPAAEAPVSANTEEKPSLIQKRRTSLFNGLGSKKDKKSSEATSETEVKEGETKKSPLPQKLGGLFRKPSKAVKSDETGAEPAPTATESTPTAGAAEGVTASPAKDDAALTNGTSEAPKEPTEQVAAPTTDPKPEVKATA